MGFWQAKYFPYACSNAHIFHFLLGRDDFHNLLNEVEVSRCNAFAKGTYSNLHTQFRTYFSFCVYFHRRPLPAHRTTIYAYVQFLSRSLRMPSVRNYLSGVRMLHIFLGLPYHFSEDYLLHLVLRGLARMHRHVPIRAKPVTPKILLFFHRHMDHQSSLHCTVWSCCLVLFYTMARLGSILPASSSTPSHVFLSRDRVNFCVEGLVITLLHTKTIQFGKKRLHIPLLKIDSALCPVRAHTKALSFLPRRKHGPAFIYLKDGVATWLTKAVFISTFRSVLVQGDLPGSEFTGHSFRRGGASWAFQAGVPGELIQICGDWASESYKLYLEFSSQNKLDLASLLTKNLPR